MEVKLIDFMGGDVRTANAARVSFKKVVPDDILRGEDQKLIVYLSKHGHWTPFGHSVITLWQKMPIFVARQFAKHTVGFVTNEVSRRYVDDQPEFFIPDVWRGRPEGSVKQGSSDEVIIEFTEGLCKGDITDTVDGLYQHAFCVYQSMLDSGVAPEQARMVLPQSMYTEMYTTGSLAAWARAYRLRSDLHAQKEIRDLAQMWQDTIGSIKELEHSWASLTTDYTTPIITKEKRTDDFT
jgi:thymidylate synthase (FAD)